MNNYRSHGCGLVMLGFGSCLGFLACSSDTASGPAAGGAGAVSMSAGAPGLGGAGASSAGQSSAAGMGGTSAGAAGAATGMAGTSSAGTAGTGGTSGGAGNGGAAGSAGAAGGTTACPGAGKALHFQDDVGGSNTFATHVLVDLATDLPIGDSARTVEMWLYMEGAESWKREHSIIEYGASGRCQAFGIDGGDNANTDPPQFDPFTFSMGGPCTGDDNLSLVPAPPRTGWLHLAWVYDPTGKLAYLGQTSAAFLFTVNGVPQPIPSKTQTGHLLTQQTKLFIGSEQAKADVTMKDNGFTGKMDEVRVWNVARTATEISDNYKLILKGDEPGLVAYYHFDEGSGTTAKDASAKHHDALFDTANGRPAPTWTDASDLILTCKP